MANTKISALTANTNPNGNEEFVYAYNNANGKITLDTMKTFVGGAGITTLNADANIWELTDGFYETTHSLYYKTGEAVDSVGAGQTLNQMISVIADASGTRGFFVIESGYAYYGYSKSSSEGELFQLGDRAWALKRYSYVLGEGTPLSHPDGLTSYTITQVINNIDDSGTNVLSISTANPPYAGMTYIIYVNSVKQNETYTITLGNGVTNPFNIALPNASNKKCVITVLITSTTTGIVTGCTMES